MYKKFLFFFAFIIVFLPGIVKADNSVNVGINYDAHEQFNYFYEQKLNTPFYNFLVKYGNDLPSFLNTSSDNLFIFYASEFSSYELSFNIPLEAKYVIVGLQYTPGFYRNSEIYSLGISFANTPVFYFFDENADLIATEYQKQSFNISKKFKISSTDEISSANFTYMISSYYFTESSHFFNPSSEIVVTDIIYDGKRYLIDDNANYSSFIAALRKFFSFGGIEDYTDVVNTDLAYFKLYPYTNSSIPARCLRHLLSYGRTIKIPDGFEILSLDSDNYGYLFIPKDISNLKLDRKLYTSTNESINTSKISIWLNTYSLKNNEFKAPYSDTNLAKLGYKNPFTLYNINISKKLKELDESYNLTDYAISLTLQNYKYKSSLYYNPDSYVVCSINTTCTFINPLTGNEITLTDEDVYNILSSNDSTGASVDIFSPSDEQLDYAKDYSELYEYDENGDIKGFNLTKVLGQVGIFLTSFLSIIATLFSYFTLFLNMLPIEIQSLLYFLLISTVVIIIYKLIRG